MKLEPVMQSKISQKEKNKYINTCIIGNRVLPRERIGHSKYPLPTAQEKTLHMDIIRWSILKLY